ncbi:hypothetical protein [Massilia endophytica]|uniref:hypothetical protein n=1 Tax=Massilia endophytica TaxID=2899220 RepID=UPI001E3AD314|nr:hypothetical protein [Massilia endophytica]UGQ44920.1 hypothetical protein LSQ66_14045 [Massilia endophytica]
MDNDVHSRLAHIEAILPTLATKADVEALHAEMLRVASETQKWMFASVIGIFIGFGGLFLAMGNFYLKQQPPPPPVQASPAPQPAAGAAPPVQQWGSVTINPPQPPSK